MEKLYYKDAYMRSCIAEVEECRQRDGHYEVVLDRTCFYPEGGGQPGDIGCLDNVEVYDTHEKEGVVCHYTREPLEPGTQVTAAINWPHRFDLMQQHSGEHMISGVIHRKYGLDNVGFHMGADVITIDLSAELTLQQLLEVEAEVNRLIWKNEPIHVWIPEASELRKISYRSKKELTGDVRLVEIPQADICACCGTHVERTGAIGLVKILGVEKFHGGVRAELVCGERAARYFNTVFEQNRSVSQQLSAKPFETAKAVENLGEEFNRQRMRVYQLEESLFALKAQELAGAGDVLVFFDELNSDAVRRACDAIQNTCGGRCAVFSGTDDTGYKYAVGLPDGDLRTWVKDLNAKLNGRGGGKPFFVQGSVKASKRDIEAFFEI